MKKVLMIFAILPIVAGCASTQPERELNQVTGNVGVSSFSAETENPWSSASVAGARSISKATVIPAKVQRVDTVVSKRNDFGPGKLNLEVRFVTVQLGGSTDMSPRVRIFFGIYSENEENDYMANYSVGSAFELKTVKRVSGGIYELTGFFGYKEDANGDRDESKPITKITINAVNAINEMASRPSCDTNGVCLKSKIIVTPTIP